MTIALGVLANDGVVLAADTEVTWGYLKTSGDKIWTAEAHGAMAIGGAGSGAYLEAISEELLDAFRDSPKSISIKALEQKFRGILTAFHKNHVIPFAQFPNPETAFWLIIALQRGNENYLWVTEKTSLRPRSRYATVGMGCEYADALLSQIFSTGNAPKNINAGLAERIAAYVVFETKDHVQSCGKKTSLVVLRRGRVVGAAASKLRLLDYHLNACADIRTLATQYALGFPYLEDGNAETTLMNYFRDLRKVLLASETNTFEGKDRCLE